MPSFSIMSIQPGDYSPDNWSSGYRIKNGDSQDKRAELYNDFSYWMARKFQIEIDTRYANDMNIIKLVNDATNTIASNYSFLNARINSSNSEHGGLQSAINSINSYTSFLNDRINSTNTGQGKMQSQVDSLDSWVNKRIDSTNTYTYFLNDRINSTNTGQGKLQSQVDNLDSWVNKRIDSTNTYTSFLNDRIDSSNTSIGNLDSKVKSNYDWVNKRIDSTNTYTSFLNDRIDSSNSEHDGLNGKILANEARILQVDSKVSSLDFWGDLRAFIGVNDYSNNHGDADGAFTKLMKTQNKNILDSITAVGSKIDSLKTELTNVGNKIKDYTTLLTTLNLSTLANKVAIDNFATKNAENLTFLNATLKGLKNYDDLTLRNLISQRFLDYFTVAVSFDGGIQVGDGVFTKVIKGQFTRLITELNKIFTAQNTKLDSLKTELTTVGDKIKDYTILLTSMNANQVLTNAAIKDFSDDNAENLTFINSTLKGLKNYDDNSFKTYINGRFSAYFTVATDYESGISTGDGIFTKVVKGQFTRLIAELNRQLTLSFTTTTNNIDSFKMYLREEFGLLNDWFALMSEWLLKIYEKPSAVFESAPFNFDRLQEMLDGISFGNVVNEAGTNVWDVLKELIEAMGKVAEAIVKIVPDLIRELIALIIPEDKEFFSKKLNSLTGSFNTKFSGVLKISDSIKNMYTQPKNIGSLTFTLFDVELKLIPDAISGEISKFRLATGALVYLSTFIGIYKRFVGEGDVIQ